MDRERTLKLLLVEDNPADVDLFRERFGDFSDVNLELRHVTTLQDALAVSAGEQIDLTILDLHLPDSSGVETLRTFRRHHSDTAVIVLSGNVREELRTLLYEEDVQDVIDKDERATRLLARGLLYAVERHRAQASHRQLEKIVSANPNAMLVVDLAGVVQFVNDAALELFGRTRQDFVGNPLGFSTPEGASTEIEVLRPDGRRIGSMRVVQFEWEGAPAYLASVRDITIAKRLEEQLGQMQKMEAVGKLAGGVAHDFNNLLTVILGYTHVLLNKNLDPGTIGYLRQVMETAERAAALTRQLLIYSRKSPSSPESVSLNAVVSELEKILRRIIGEDVELTVNLEPDIWTVAADPVQLEQVIMNMAVNARDAMPTGGKLNIETFNLELTEALAVAFVDLSPGDYVALAISDTGCGMDQATVQRIFEPFYTTKEVSKGTGLGLATSYGVVKNSGGHIAVHSEPGRGTTFTVFLPRATHRAVGPSAAAHLPAVSAGTETILLVEDEADVREVCRLVLEALGYHVLEAASGSDAMDLVRDYAGPLDLLLTDVIMPRMNGAELADNLRSIFPQLEVLYMSGYTGHALSESAALPGGAHFIEKPFTTRSLAQSVQTVLAPDRKIQPGRP